MVFTYIHNICFSFFCRIPRVNIWWPFDDICASSNIAMPSLLLLLLILFCYDDNVRCKCKACHRLRIYECMKCGLIDFQFIWNCLLRLLRFIVNILSYFGSCDAHAHMSIYVTCGMCMYYIILLQTSLDILPLWAHQIAMASGNRFFPLFHFVAVKKIMRSK